MKRILVTCAYILTGLTILYAQSAGGPNLTLDQARKILSDPSSKVLDGIDLNALNYYRELDIGGGFRVMVFSKDMSGALVLFSPKGVASSSVTTGEITWLQLFDLNEDGISELVTEESEGHATDILVKNFAIYECDSKGIRKLWQARSYEREVLGGHGDIRERPFFLRFDAAGGGEPTKMTYLQPLNKPGQFKKTIYVMVKGALRERPPGQ